MSFWEEVVIRLFYIIIIALALNAQEVNIQILTTTNLHGRILPQDSYTLQPMNQGWARLATVIRNLRLNNPNTIAIDCGNTIYGEPINYVWSRLGCNLPEPSMAIMNSLKYSAMLVGDSELYHGIKQLRTIESQAKFPLLAANIISASNSREIFAPYTLINICGVRVAILGLNTTRRSITTKLDGSEEINFHDPVIVSKNLVSTLRQKEHADMIVLAINGESGLYVKNLESVIKEITTQTSDIDLIVAGHTNKKIDSTINGIPVLQAGPLGTTIGIVNCSFCKKTGDRWELRLNHSKLVPVGPETNLDPIVMELTTSLRSITEKYLNTFATNLNIDLDSRWAKMESTAIMQLLHSVAKQASNADITAIATPSSKIFIPKGPTSVRQFYSLYPNDYHVVKIRITGRQLRAYLEWSTNFYTFSHHLNLFNKDFSPDNFDTLDGCNYSLDISRPLGSRVIDLKIHGQLVKDSQNLTMCICSNRIHGAGGYLDAMGWNGKPELISPVPLRNLLLEYVLSKPSLTINIINHWRIVPALDRERVLIQQP
jgi:2',3'-cyclic-nucleotide 2'-phosphodiesterase/3'-nucleotidase